MEKGIQYSPTPEPSSPNTNDTSSLRPLILFAVAMSLSTLLLMIVYCTVWNRAQNLRAGVVVVGTSTSRGPRQAGGLSHDVLDSIPVFVHSTADQENRVECSVCLGEFGEGEKGRMLPLCGHSFHVECVDKWLQSHSTCPLCRSTVQSQGSKSMPEIV